MIEQIFLHNVRASFTLREPKKETPTKIYLVYSIRGKQVKLNTGLRVYPEHWNSKKQEAYVNARLTELDNRNNEIANREISKLKGYFEEFKNYLCEHPDDIENCLAIWKTYLKKDSSKPKPMKAAPKKVSTPKEIEKTIEEEVTPIIGSDSPSAEIRNYVEHSRNEVSTIEKDLRNLNVFERFLQEKSIADSWENMNLKTLNRYQDYIIMEMGNEVSTAKECLFVVVKTLKELAKNPHIPFNYSDSLIANLKYTKDRRSKEQKASKTIPLTEEEIERLYKVEFKDGHKIKAYMLEEVRDLFVLQCYTGQRISDLPKVVNADIKGKDVITLLSTDKTKACVTIPLFPLARNIITKYQKSKFQYLNIDYTTPKGAKRLKDRLNHHLKNVFKLAGFNEEITVHKKGIDLKMCRYEVVSTHDARHTFVTMMYRRGISKENIIMVTGHNDTTMLDKVYLHPTIKDKANIVSDAFLSKK